MNQFLQTSVVPKAQMAACIGKEFPPGDWFRIDQDRVNQFADVTLDHQFIHVDPEKAKDTPFGGTIVHGFLTLSLLVHLTADRSLVPEERVMGVNYGFDKIRFLQPVRVGAEIRARSLVADVTEKETGEMLVKQLK